MVIVDPGKKLKGWRELPDTLLAICQTLIPYSKNSTALPSPRFPDPSWDNAHLYDMFGHAVAQLELAPTDKACQRQHCAAGPFPGDRWPLRMRNKNQKMIKLPLTLTKLSRWLPRGLNFNFPFGFYYTRCSLSSGAEEVPGAS
ncbi:hypothetical protein Y1Q_0015445 [Alligator mississippiensis]|uniref:Uncharacterized protein n=1 Tax=Alligator mississippiensis TaxID=8496 RepID=A0A151NCW4_ALLMI|nr:hypothetical protein Y1Q_0015445 [Alligator mississippiensis]